MAEQRSFGETMKYAWDEGLARHVVVSNDERTVLNLPLTVILVIALFASPLVALGVIVALVLGYRIEMQRSGSDATMIIMDEPPLRDSFRHERTSPGDEPPAPTPIVPEAPPTTSMVDGEAPVPGDTTAANPSGDDTGITVPSANAGATSSGDPAATSPGDAPAAGEEGNDKPAWTWEPPA